MGKLDGIHFPVPWEHVKCDCNLLMGLSFEPITSGWNNTLPSTLVCNCVVKTSVSDGMVVLSSFSEDVRKYLESFGSLVRISVQHVRNCSATNQVHNENFILPIAMYYDTPSTRCWVYGDILLGIGNGYERGIAKYMTEVVKWTDMSVEEIIMVSMESYCGAHAFVV